MKIAFVAALSDKKLSQKLEPLQNLPEVQQIDLFRRQPYQGNKIRWVPLSESVRKSRSLGDIARFCSLFTATGKNRYDLIVGCHQEYHGVMAMVAGKVWRTPVVQMVISGVDWVHERPLFRLPMMTADACGVRGPTSIERIRAHGYRGPVEVIANPLEMPTSRGGTLPFSQRRFHLVAVGDWAGIKDYPGVLRIVAQVRKQIPNFRLGIVGKGAYEENLGGLLDELRLRDSVEFLGWQDEDGLARVYRDSSAMILNSYSEGLPMVVLEAMSFSVPVFVTAVGENPWLIRDGVEGRIFPHGDYDAMARALIEGFRNLPELEAMGRRGNERLKEQLPAFQLDRISENWRKLIRAVTEKR